ncbi:MAG: transporter substrate-binding domain-containing protein [Gemmatimonadaceae bacterium]|nr:transporter substrate-binding domain-containing protein [Gemmatimonadaceae bacterium]NUR20522.1 transporter substrate-binding domain-containing protein [Gemmatimonadaceae bacterium]
MFTIVAVAALAGCDLPRDPDGTLKRVRGGTMRVGMVVDTPWVTDSGDGAGGIERTIVDDLSRELGAKVEWHRGSAEQLLDSLHERELDLVIGGFTTQSPWKQQVALTKAYYTDTLMLHGKRTEQPHAVAVAPGENAWQVAVERVLRGKRNEFPTLRRAAGR